MASETDICNRALQMLGAKRITSLIENTPNARSCNVAYATIRDAELSDHPWNFAIIRASLPASSTAPAFDKANAFPLPTDFLRLLDPDPDQNFPYRDWQIENGSILTDDQAPLQVRYVAQTTDPNVMPPLFREAVAARLALELCEEITQSNKKKDGLRVDYKEIISRAKKQNAIQNRPATQPDDTWLTERN